MNPDETVQSMKGRWSPHAAIVWQIGPRESRATGPWRLPCLTGIGGGLYSQPLPLGRQRGGWIVRRAHDHEDGRRRLPMARSRRMTLALGGAALLLGLGLVSACSSPTAAPGGVPGQPVDGSGGFDLPPGPVNVPPGGEQSGYPGDSLQRFPTARSPYPAPDETGSPGPGRGRRGGGRAGRGEGARARARRGHTRAGRLIGAGAGAAGGLSAPALHVRRGARRAVARTTETQTGLRCRFRGAAGAGPGP